MHQVVYLFMVVKNDMHPILSEKSAMPNVRLTAILFSIFCFALASRAHAEQPPATPGATHVARWKDDKKAAFMLMFDDSAPTHVKYVFPELKRRELIATFYINPGKGEWAAFKNAWEKELPAAGMEFGNHTMTHKGVHDVADAEGEIGKCNDIITQLFPGKSPRLISYGQPGVPKGAWNINDQQLKEILAKDHLIHRPNVDGRFAFIHLKTVDEMVRVMDGALEKGVAECVLFHGVGGDWLTFPLAGFKEFLDKIVEKRDKLWITTHIQEHKYETERDSATVSVLESTPAQIRVELKCTADPELYDAPLTLVTQVPATWTKCEITQGSAKTAVSAANGSIKYDALPDGRAITIRAVVDGK